LLNIGCERYASQIEQNIDSAHTHSIAPSPFREELNIKNNDSLNKSFQYQVQDVIEMELKSQLNSAKSNLSQLQKDMEMALLKNTRSRDE